MSSLPPSSLPGGELVDAIPPSSVEEDDTMDDDAATEADASSSSNFVVTIVKSWGNDWSVGGSGTTLPAISQAVGGGMIILVTTIIIVIVASSSLSCCFGFHQSSITASTSKRARSNNHSSIHHPHDHRHRSSTLLCMVRNVDLPEAIVFYGIESIMEAHVATNANNKECSIQRLLRPGVKRLLEECNEVGTASLLLSEDNINDDDYNNRLVSIFREAYNNDDDTVHCSNTIHVRCLNHTFLTHTLLANNEAGYNNHSDDNDDESLIFYNLQANGRSPSPAFLLDSLNSVQINPRGFGGHSGFGRGQWTEPRRCPLPARTVVFIAGDWSSSTPPPPQEEGEETKRERIVKTKRSTLSRDRCSAARAAGCRIIYLEQQQQQQQQPSLDDPTTNSQQHLVMIHDDESTMSLCDAVIDTYGNDNIRELLQPISLDAISTPGNYWLNPPTPRDDFGNSVSVDDLVNKYHSERLVHHRASCESLQEDERDENVNEGIMSEQEIDSILADLDGP